MCLAEVGASAGFQEGKGDEWKGQGWLSFCAPETVSLQMQLETVHSAENPGVNPLEFTGSLPVPPQTQRENAGGCADLSLLR